MTDTVAAVVVTYNRKNLLIECLDALLKQTRPVQKIILIDNASTDGTPEFLRERGYLNNSFIEYTRLPENTGGAGGFHEGVKRGQELGYDWLWLMDDDAEPELNALEILSHYFNQNDTAALANLKVGIDGVPQYGHRGWFNFCAWSSQVVKPIDDKALLEETVEIDHASFVGILIKKISVDAIGLPKEDFFIHYDDVEYCSRIRSCGNIILIPASRIIHKDGAGRRLVTRISFGRTSDRFPIDKMWISYFGYRNMIWLKKSKCSIYPLLIFFIALRQAVGIMIYDDHKINRLRFYLGATLDGVKGRFNNKSPLKYMK